MDTGIPLLGTEVSLLVYRPIIFVNLSVGDVPPCPRVRGDPLAGTEPPPLRKFTEMMGLYKLRGVHNYVNTVSICEML